MAVLRRHAPQALARGAVALAVSLLALLGAPSVRVRLTATPASMRGCCVSRARLTSRERPSMGEQSCAPTAGSATVQWTYAGLAEARRKATSGSRDRDRQSAASARRAADQTAPTSESSVSPAAAAAAAAAGIVTAGMASSGIPLPPVVARERRLRSGKPMGASRPRELKNFEGSLRKQGGKLHSNVWLEMYPDATSGGAMRVRCVMRRGAVPADTALVVVPEKLLMHPDVSGMEGFDDHQRLALRLLQEAALGPKSLWNPWMELLPTPDDLNNVFVWRQPELDALAGSYTGVVVNRELQDFDAFARAAAEWAVATEQVPGAFGRDQLAWAVGCVRSRAFTILKDKHNTEHFLNQRPFLAPGADFLNHNPGAAISWRLAATKAHGPFEVFTRAELKSPEVLRGEAAAAIKGAAGDAAAGQEAEAAAAAAADAVPEVVEVYNNYQNFSSTALLVSFGFVLSDNPADELPISLPVPQGMHNAAEKEALLASLGSEPSQYFRRSGVSPALLNRVRVITMDDAHLEALRVQLDALQQARQDSDGDGDSGGAGGERSGSGFDVSSQHLPVDAAVDSAARAMLSDAIQGLKRGFTTTLAQDRALLEADAAARDGGDAGAGAGASAGASLMSPRVRLAVQARLLEKEVLEIALAQLTGGEPPPTGLPEPRLGGASTAAAARGGGVDAEL